MLFAGLNQFVVYKVVPSATRPGKTDKFPCSYLTGKVVSAHDPQHWTDEATARATAMVWGSEYGIGFVFTESDPYWFLDIDGCLVDGAWSPLAVALCSTFAGCYIEVSHSGTGLHIFGRGTPPAHACKNAPLGLEFYHSGRFVALTGSGAVGSEDIDATAALPDLVAAYFEPDEALAVAIEADGPGADWNGPTDDTELIRRAMQSKSVSSVFGGKASFADLWTANEMALAASYPDPARAYGESEADAALAQHLAFWTGRDAARIERLMWQSSLVRDKWTEHPTYLRELTIAGACSRQVEVLCDPPSADFVAPVAAPGEVVHELVPRGGNGYCNLEQQRAHFAGCVYITGQNKALIPVGTMMKPEAFRIRFGGFIFNMDANNEKTTRDAWEAWTQSQVHQCVIVEGICFKPNLPPREIVTINGLRYINSYIPVDIARKQGDPSPFLNHLAKVLPDERDRSILLAYMAACVQHQGIKFQWAPLLQGVEGNGKTLFARCVEKAVGERYTHWPMAKKLGKDFNAWMVGKVFFAVEDIYVPDSKREILEDLKPMITGGSIEIEAKGVDQVSLDICGNFMFNSNHRDAIRKTENDRRFCILYSAQQARGDLALSGMDGDYFPNLYKWLNADGYAIVSEFLTTYSIPMEYNPAGSCQRAPLTSSTGEAIAANAGQVEQEILEAIAQGLPGFCGGWISTVWLDRLLERLRLQRISHVKRKQILETMGYGYHPALTDGRTNNVVTPDNTKPRLFVKSSSLPSQIPSAAGAAKDYEAANTGRAVGLPFAHRA
jgi:hypothetical protein